MFLKMMLPYTLSINKVYCIGRRILTAICSEYYSSLQSSPTAVLALWPRAIALDMGKLFGRVAPNASDTRSALALEIRSQK